MDYGEIVALVSNCSVSQSVVSGSWRPHGLRAPGLLSLHVSWVYELVSRWPVMPPTMHPLCPPSPPAFILVRFEKSGLCCRKLGHSLVQCQIK